MYYKHRVLLVKSNYAVTFAASLAAVATLAVVAALAAVATLAAVADLAVRGGGPRGGGTCSLGLGLVPVRKRTGTNPRSHSEG